MANYGPYMAHIWVRYGIVRTVLWNFELWQVHGIESLRRDLYHHSVRDNYGNQVPIGIPYQVLRHTSFTCSVATIRDHLVIQENRGSKLPIVIPYQQLIHSLLYLLYGLIIMWSISYTAKTVYRKLKAAKKNQKQTSQCFARISEH